MKTNSNDAITVIKAADYFLADVELFAKKHWLAYYGELQLPQNELPLWILIAEKASICEAHQQLLELYQPFYSRLLKVQLNIYFYRKQMNSKYCQFFTFQNTQDFLRGHIDGQILTEDTYDKIEKHNIEIFNRIY
ncbi:hypothetical protein N5853_05160 [Bartonella sp. HY329]|uniref:hypothetical protein n=1 Tax=unclassified Bartonella TaxID=2645622 RepID=UPI0021C5BE5B|nr:MULTISPECIES: hypothetical protein [unclassified Bartonella]UXM96013.1 hypothetical protein N5853_05160 [Bartonella sp. HY329]UXN10338.1 hypothetical protein N5852_05170 [Bartonella sp. HY328]